ncbi:FAD binding domain-containing protein [Anaeroselena agilis]|uniref:FAD binding domain-containing protein n=1 Tax=Anaeroselena agilis TaxID=3063788 RepID=A0ABU3P2X5_9FIRM|nr:FAD binding domain-containing protein [Selenomonadales bacterium 4137-cl]
MIPIDFDYYRPDTVAEATKLYHDLAAAEKRPLYYGGGTEIITMARAYNLDTGAVIDIKGIPACSELGFAAGKLAIGAGVTLTRISEAKLWSFLAKAGGRIADHTTQGKITLGGNICGTIIYHEALLPLLLTDCEVVVAGEKGERRVSIHKVFDQRPRLEKGEMVVQFLVEEEFLDLPYVHVKRTKSEKIDYPLVSFAALKNKDEVRVAFSGVCAFPFRSADIERIINEKGTALEERVRRAVRSVPAPLLNDVSGSSGYREFVLANTLQNTLTAFEGKESA